MKHAMALATILLLTSWMAMAQTPGSTSETAHQNQSVTVEGCLGGGAGHYSILTQEGKNMQIDSKDPNLAKMVGHTVRATGMENPGTTTTTNATNETPNGATNTGAELALTTSKVTDVSSTCSVSTSSAKPH